ncbi:MAG: pseudaminic acid synthase [Acidimicrobiia bacterium]|nr:pseudaminic acid synthase [Acidimicrobiia bacterium]
MTSFRIGNRDIGIDFSPYVIAEISANHAQDFDRAIALVDAAASSGVDAVKFQTYTPDTITLVSDNEHFRLDTGTVWDGQTLHDLYAKAYTPWDWQPKLAARALEHGIHWFSSPFDPTAVDFLETLDPPAYKVASFEIVDVGLLKAIAATGRPVIVSTGMATLEEIDEAVSVLREAGSGELALLRTNSGYPAMPSEMDLSAIPAMAERYGVAIGLSDHTLAPNVPVVAVGLGASLIEKHLTLSREMETEDSKFSLEPAEFAAMVAAVREAHGAIGTPRFGPSPREEVSLKYRRSLFVARDVAAGEEFTAENVRSVRPGTGMHTRHLDDVIGKTAAADVAAGTPMEWSLVASE